MPVAMSMRWSGVTPQQYDALRKVVNWEGDVPKGAVHHVIWFEGDAARVVDVWETAEDFQQFVDERLMPGVGQVGIQGEPEVELRPAYAVFAPYETARV